MVLISNFTASLDHMSVLAADRGWGTLRIDGKTGDCEKELGVMRWNREEGRNIQGSW